MNTTLKLLYAVTITALLVSCGGGENDTNHKTPNPANNKDPKKLEEKIVITDSALNKKSLISGYTESFEFNLQEEEEGGTFNIITIVMSADMECFAGSVICDDIYDFLGESKLVFNALKEQADPIEDRSLGYRMRQKGNIEINGKKHTVSLYYNKTSSNDKVGFEGKLVFELPAITLLKGELLIIATKK